MGVVENGPGQGQIGHAQLSCSQGLAGQLLVILQAILEAADCGVATATERLQAIAATGQERVGSGPLYRGLELIGIFRSRRCPQGCAPGTE